MSTTMTPGRSRPDSPWLSDTLLARCAQRAPGYDHEHRFCAGDFQELRDAGYLRIAIPKELGGPGLSLAQVVHEQRRLGYHAAPTALPRSGS